MCKILETKIPKSIKISKILNSKGKLSPQVSAGQVLIKFLCYHKNMGINNPGTDLRKVKTFQIYGGLQKNKWNLTLANYI